MSFDAVEVIAQLAPWDVIYPFDRLAKSPKHKMWVCVSRDDLWFLRISTKSYRDCCVPLSCKANPFLDHESYLGCGGDLITSAESEFETLLALQTIPERQGILGAVSIQERPTVVKAIETSGFLTPAQVRIMKAELAAGTV